MQNFVQSGPKYRVIFRAVFFLLVFILTGSFILFKYFFIDKYSSLSAKLKETMLHCVLFCFPKHHSILVPLSLILVLSIIHITLNVKFVYSLKAQIFHMKGLGAKSLKHKKMITYISSVSLTTSCIIITLCLLLFTLLFTSSFFISYSLVIVLWLYSMNNISTFLLSNKDFFEIFRGCLSGKKNFKQDSVTLTLRQYDHGPRLSHARPKLGWEGEDGVVGSLVSGTLLLLLPLLIQIKPKEREDR